VKEPFFLSEGGLEMTFSYKDLIEGIVNAKSLERIRRAVEQYRYVVSCQKDDEDVFADILMEELEKKTDSPIHYMLHTFLDGVFSNNEISNCLFEFFFFCDHFKRAKKNETNQITVREFFEILDELEEKRQIRSVLEKEHQLVVFETNMASWFNSVKIVCLKGKMFIPLPKIENAMDKKQYICRLIGICLFELCNAKRSYKQMIMFLYGHVPQLKSITETRENLFQEKLYEAVMCSAERNKEIESDFKLYMHDFIYKLKQEIEVKKDRILLN